MYGLEAHQKAERRSVRRSGIFFYPPRSRRGIFDEIFFRDGGGLGTISYATLVHAYIPTVTSVMSWDGWQAVSDEPVHVCYLECTCKLSNYIWFGLEVRSNWDGVSVLTVHVHVRSEEKMLGVHPLHSVFDTDCLGTQRRRRTLGCCC